MYINVIPACTPTCQKLDGCELPCGCWVLNSGPLKKLSVLLTTEPSLQPSRCFLRSPGWPGTQRSACLCLSGVVTIGMCHLAWVVQITSKITSASSLLLFLSPVLTGAQLWIIIHPSSFKSFSLPSPFSKVSGGEASQRYSACLACTRALSLIPQAPRSKNKPLLLNSFNNL